MNETTLAELLQDTTPGLRISIYQPTHPASSEQSVREDAIRFKNALQAIRSSESYDDSLGATMKSLAELVDDVEFWKHQTPGLAVFVDTQGYRTISLHYDVTEAYFMGEQYQVSPLVLAESMGSNYYLLGINHTRPRLLLGSPSSCSELLLDDMPGSFESITDTIEFTNERQHQQGDAYGFYGHSDESSLHDTMMSYYRNIAKSVDEYLAGHSEPLVLMGVDNRVGMIRKALSYPHVLDEYIEGNGEAMNEQELYDRSITVIEAYNAKRRNDVVRTFQETKPALAAVGDDAVNAALGEHRVAKLLLPSFLSTADTVRRGYDASIVLQLHHDTPETTESLVRLTLLQGGEVVAMAMDDFEDTQPRAICRF